MTDFKKLILDAAVNFDKNRNQLLENFKNSKKDIEIIENDLNCAKEIESEFEKLEIISKIESFDTVSFISIDIEPKENVLFGEITRAIQDAIELELEEFMNSKESTPSKNATPEILKNNYILKKNELINDLIFDGDFENQKNMITIRCVQLYSEISQDIESVSKRSADKLKEHQELLMFIGVTPKPNLSITESNMTEIISYTIAISSSIEDGNKPNIDNYKNKIINSINNGINSVSNSENVKLSIESFKDVSLTMDNISEKLKNVENSSELIKTIASIKQICEESSRKIESIHSVDLEM